MTSPALDPWISADELDYTADDRVAWATAQVREYCNWHIFPSITETVEVHTNGGQELVLPTLRLTSLGPVIIHTVAVGDDEVVTITDAPVSPTMLKVRDYGSVQRLDWRAWPYTPGSVTVEFTHGYAVLPEALRNVAVALALRAPREMSGVTQEAAGGVSRRYDPHAGTGFYAWETTVMDAYQLPGKP